MSAPSIEMRKVSEAKRQMVARRIAEDFQALSPDAKRKFVDDTLTVLVNMSKRQMQKLFARFVKRGKPSTKDLETVNQLITVFFYSVKPEYQPHYAAMIYKSLNMPLPPDFQEKVEQVRKLIFLSDIGLSPEAYGKLFEAWEKMGKPKYDDFFNHLTSNLK